MTAPRQMVFTDLEKPTARSGEALVRMQEVAVCGSDLVPYLGTQPFEYPLTVGKSAHECVGTIVESDIAGFSPGDRVLYFPPKQDALREFAVAENAIQLLKLPAYGNISHWLLAQLLGTVVHSARLLGSVLGERVAVIGQGPVGQLWNVLLRNLGARSIIGIDMVPERLEVSPRMGATHTLRNTGPEIIKSVCDLTGGRGADIVIEAAGYTSAHQLMFELVRQDGRICMFGHPKPLTSEIPVHRWYERRAQVITSWGPDVDGDIGLALEMIEQKRIDVTPVLTHRFPFSQVHEAYELFAERRDGCIKVIVDFNE
jgi:L-iditol 2-dehydrogenase